MTGSPLLWGRRPRLQRVSRPAVAFLLAVAFASAAPPAKPPAFSGTAALEFTRKAVSFGQRPAGSEANRKLQDLIHAELKPLGCEVTDDPFRASTPLGPVAMRNIVARFPGTSGQIVVITGHYDTKSIPGTTFLGANDGGSSAGFLLEMARVVSRLPHKNDIYLVWLDGEEAIAEWSDTDSTYGSRQLAARWATDGTISRIKALINVDMIGDRDLSLVNDGNSTDWLRRLVWETAGQLGLGNHFSTVPGSLEDDHIPFIKAGVSAVDLIDFDYGPDNSWWHTDRDTMDKLSAASLQVVGDVVLATLRRLEP
ncbi:MAG TPA: M28 family peptidase [Bryobacteraceae bacterium]|nr:M28 family peptidase [Bryobacteraceae bacterium]